jgi:hypothetical protein
MVHQMKEASPDSVRHMKSSVTLDTIFTTEEWKSVDTRLPTAIIKQHEEQKAAARAAARAAALAKAQAERAAELARQQQIQQQIQQEIQARIDAQRADSYRQVYSRPDLGCPDSGLCDRRIPATSSCASGGEYA